MRPGTASICQQCHAPLVPGARFCLACGTAVTAGGGAFAGATVASTASTLAGLGTPLAALSEAERQAQLSQLLVEATLGEFEILGELGRGGMATVFLAHDLALDRKVAIKVIAPTLLAAPGAVERFKRESRTAGALSHPHIIPIHSVRETPQLLFFVMKFVEGRSLDEIIREQGALPIRMVQAILTEVGHALAYAHRRGVVHRDIKPANIMLDAEGWAVVTDFGIAKVLESDSLTVSGAMVGTPFYMSPEQCSGKAVTGASDQYSLGVVAYEMLTGKPPFSGETIMEIMKGHFFEAPVSVELLRPDCPPALAAAVTRMLRKDPAERWASMDEAVAACEASPLAQDDPVRGEMIALARSSESLRRISRLSIPVSPIPAAWSRARPLTTSNPTAAPRPTLQGSLAEEPPAPASRSVLLPLLLAVLGLTAVGAGAAFLLRAREAALPPSPAGTSAGTPIQPESLPTEPALVADTAVPSDSGPTTDTAAVATAPVPAAPRPTPEQVEAERRQALTRYLAELRVRLEERWKARVINLEDVDPADQLTWRITMKAGRLDNPIPLGGSRLLDATAGVAADDAVYGTVPAPLRRGDFQFRVTFSAQGTVTVQP